jgi:hypothetical protein
MLRAEDCSPTDEGGSLYEAHYLGRYGGLADEGWDFIAPALK